MLGDERRYADGGPIGRERDGQAIPGSHIARRGGNHREAEMGGLSV